MSSHSQKLASVEWGDGLYVCYMEKGTSVMGKSFTSHLDVTHTILISRTIYLSSIFDISRDQLLLFLSASQGLKYFFKTNTGWMSCKGIWVPLGGKSQFGMLWEASTIPSLCIQGWLFTVCNSKQRDSPEAAEHPGSDFQSNPTYCCWLCRS